MNENVSRTPKFAFIRDLRGICSLAFGLLVLAFVSTIRIADAQTVSGEDLKSSHAITLVPELPTPLSECPLFRSEPIAAAWCSLTQASPVLQSVQIIVVGIVAIVAIGRPLYARRKRRTTMMGGSVTKKIVNIEKSRLTSITDDLGNGWFVAGFSGKLWKIDRAFRATEVFSESVGLVRCLVQGTARDSVLIGGDDGALHVFNIRTSTLKRLATLGGPIYRLANTSDRHFIAAIGTGDVALVEIQHSPGQDDYSFRELWRIKAHTGSAFDALSVKGGFVSVGADGRLVEISTAGKITSSFQVADCTVWSVAKLGNDALILGCNDGTLVKFESGAIASKVKNHQAGVRLVLASPKGQWCISLGKDRSVFATLADLSATVLLHRSKDYLYDGCVSDDGHNVLVCDGAGDLTKISFDRSIDNYDQASLAARIS